VLDRETRPSARSGLPQGLVRLPEDPGRQKVEREAIANYTSPGVLEPRRRCGNAFPRPMRPHHHGGRSRQTLVETALLAELPSRWRTSNTRGWGPAGIDLPSGSTLPHLVLLAADACSRLARAVGVGLAASIAGPASRPERPRALILQTDEQRDGGAPRRRRAACCHFVSRAGQGAVDRSRSNPRRTWHHVVAPGATAKRTKATGILEPLHVLTRSLVEHQPQRLLKEGMCLRPSSPRLDGQTGNSRRLGRGVDSKKHRAQRPRA